jgi:uncharacterized protein (DUF885 family)
MRLARLPAAVMSVWAAASASTSAAAPASPGVTDPALASIVAAYSADAETRRVAAQLQQGKVVARFPAGTLDEARQTAVSAKRYLAKLATVRLDELSDEDRLSAEILTWSLEHQLDAERLWWYEFPVTTYTTFDLTIAAQALAANPLRSDADRAAYLSMIDALAVRLETARDKLRRQAARQIRLPAPAAASARQFFAAMSARFSALPAETDARLGSMDATARAEYLAEVRRRVDTRVQTAREALVAVLTRAEREGPSKVGLAQYRGGKDVYRELVRFHTSLDLTPEQVMAYGEQRIASINTQIDALAQQLGIPGGRAGIRAMLKKDTRFLARTPDDVAVRYAAALARIAPEMPQYFSTMPTAAYGVRRLDPAAEGSMTFGYYQQPMPNAPTGEYRFNGSRLEDRSLVFAAPVIYHELIPGHHLQMALQLENVALPPFRRVPGAFGFNAYTEGWAEYAAGLAGEMGMYADPWDRLGRLMLEAFLTSRLVVDPGMNYFGWPLERARAYMRDNTYQSMTEIDSETVRYSTAIPGQALGYKIGDKAIYEMRHAVEAKQGSAFDIRAFHAELIGHGAMPLSVLRDHVARHFRTGPIAP